MTGSKKGIQGHSQPVPRVPSAHLGPSGAMPFDRMIRMHQDQTAANSAHHGNQMDLYPSAHQFLPPGAVQGSMPSMQMHSQSAVHPYGNHPSIPLPQSMMAVYQQQQQQQQQAALVFQQRAAQQHPHSSSSFHGQGFNPSISPSFPPLNPPPNGNGMETLPLMPSGMLHPSPSPSPRVTGTPGMIGAAPLAPSFKKPSLPPNPRQKKAQQQTASPPAPSQSDHVLQPAQMQEQFMTLFCHQNGGVAHSEVAQTSTDKKGPKVRGRPRKTTDEPTAEVPRAPMLPPPPPHFTVRVPTRMPPSPMSYDPVMQQHPYSGTVGSPVILGSPLPSPQYPQQQGSPMTPSNPSSQHSPQTNGQPSPHSAGSPSKPQSSPLAQSHPTGSPVAQSPLAQSGPNGSPMAQSPLVQSRAVASPMAPPQMPQQVQLVASVPQSPAAPRYPLQKQLATTPMPPVPVTSLAPAPPKVEKKQGSDISLRPSLSSLPHAQQVKIEEKAKEEKTTMKESDIAFHERIMKSKQSNTDPARRSSKENNFEDMELKESEKVKSVKRKSYCSEEPGPSGLQSRSVAASSDDEDDMDLCVVHGCTSRYSHIQTIARCHCQRDWEQDLCTHEVFPYKMRTLDSLQYAEARGHVRDGAYMCAVLDLIRTPEELREFGSVERLKEWTKKARICSRHFAESNRFDGFRLPIKAIGKSRAEIVRIAMKYGLEALVPPMDDYDINHPNEASPYIPWCSFWDPYSLEHRPVYPGDCPRGEELTRFFEDILSGRIRTDNNQRVDERERRQLTHQYNPGVVHGLEGNYAWTLDLAIRVHEREQAEEKERKEREETRIGKLIRRLTKDAKKEETNVIMKEEDRYTEKRWERYFEIVEMEEKEKKECKERVKDIKESIEMEIYKIKDLERRELEGMEVEVQRLTVIQEEERRREVKRLRLVRKMKKQERKEQGVEKKQRREAENERKRVEEEKERNRREQEKEKERAEAEEREKKREEEEQKLEKERKEREDAEMKRKRVDEEMKRLEEEKRKREMEEREKERQKELEDQERQKRELEEDERKQKEEEDRRAQEEAKEVKREDDLIVEEPQLSAQREHRTTSSPPLNSSAQSTPPHEPGVDYPSSPSSCTSESLPANRALDGEHREMRQEHPEYQGEPAHDKIKPSPLNINANSSFATTTPPHSGPSGNSENKSFSLLVETASNSTDLLAVAPANTNVRLAVFISQCAPVPRLPENEKDENEPKPTLPAVPPREDKEESDEDEDEDDPRPDRGGERVAVLAAGSPGDSDTEKESTASSGNEGKKEEIGESILNFSSKSLFLPTSSSSSLLKKSHPGNGSSTESMPTSSANPHSTLQLAEATPSIVGPIVPAEETAGTSGAAEVIEMEEIPVKSPIEEEAELEAKTPADIALGEELPVNDPVETDPPFVAPLPSPSAPVDPAADTAHAPPSSIGDGDYSSSALLLPPQNPPEDQKDENEEKKMRNTPDKNNISSFSSPTIPPSSTVSPEERKVSLVDYPDSDESDGEDEPPRGETDESRLSLELDMEAEQLAATLTPEQQRASIDEMLKELTGPPDQRVAPPQNHLNVVRDEIQYPVIAKEKNDDDDDVAPPPASLDPVPPAEVDGAYIEDETEEKTEEQNYEEPSAPIDQPPVDESGETKDEDGEELEEQPIETPSKAEEKIEEEGAKEDEIEASRLAFRPPSSPQEEVIPSGEDDDALEEKDEDESAATDEPIDPLLVVECLEAMMKEFDETSPSEVQVNGQQAAASCSTATDDGNEVEKGDDDEKEEKEEEESPLACAHLSQPMEPANGVESLPVNTVNDEETRDEEEEEIEETPLVPTPSEPREKAEDDVEKDEASGDHDGTIEESPRAAFHLSQPMESTTGMESLPPSDVETREEEEEIEESPLVPPSGTFVPRVEADDDAVDDDMAAHNDEMTDESPLVPPSEPILPPQDEVVGGAPVEKRKNSETSALATPPSESTPRVIDPIETQKDDNGDAEEGDEALEEEQEASAPSEAAVKVEVNDKEENEEEKEGEMPSLSQPKEEEVRSDAERKEDEEKCMDPDNTEASPPLSGSTPRVVVPPESLKEGDGKEDQPEEKGDLTPSTLMHDSPLVPPSELVLLPQDEVVDETKEDEKKEGEDEKESEVPPPSQSDLEEEVISSDVEEKMEEENRELPAENTDLSPPSLSPSGVVDPVVTGEGDDGELEEKREGIPEEKDALPPSEVVSDQGDDEKEEEEKDEVPTPIQPTPSLEEVQEVAISTADEKNEKEGEMPPPSQSGEEPEVVSSGVEEKKDEEKTEDTEETSVVPLPSESTGASAVVHPSLENGDDGEVHEKEELEEEKEEQPAELKDALLPSEDVVDEKGEEEKDDGKAPPPAPPTLILEEVKEVAISPKEEDKEEEIEEIEGSGVAEMTEEPSTLSAPHDEVTKEKIVKEEDDEKEQPSIPSEPVDTHRVDPVEEEVEEDGEKEVGKEKGEEVEEAPQLAAPRSPRESPADPPADEVNDGVEKNDEEDHEEEKADECASPVPSEGELVKEEFVESPSNSPTYVEVRFGEDLHEDEEEEEEEEEDSTPSEDEEIREEDIDEVNHPPDLPLINDPAAYNYFEDEEEKKEKTEKKKEVFDEQQPCSSAMAREQDAIYAAEMVARALYYSTPAAPQIRIINDPNVSDSDSEEDDNQRPGRAMREPHGRRRYRPIEGREESEEESSEYEEEDGEEADYEEEDYTPFNNQDGDNEAGEEENYEGGEEGEEEEEEERRLPDSGEEIDDEPPVLELQVPPPPVIAVLSPPRETIMNLNERERDVHMNEEQRVIPSSSTSIEDAAPSTPSKKKITKRSRNARKVKDEGGEEVNKEELKEEEKEEEREETEETPNASRPSRRAQKRTAHFVESEEEEESEEEYDEERSWDLVVEGSRHLYECHYCDHKETKTKRRIHRAICKGREEMRRRKVVDESEEDQQPGLSSSTPQRQRQVPQRYRNSGASPSSHSIIPRRPSTPPPIATSIPATPQRRQSPAVDPVLPSTMRSGRRMTAVPPKTRESPPSSSIDPTSVRRRATAVPPRPSSPVPSVSLQRESGDFPSPSISSRARHARPAAGLAVETRESTSNSASSAVPSTASPLASTSSVELRPWLREKWSKLSKSESIDGKMKRKCTICKQFVDGRFYDHLKGHSREEKDKKQAEYEELEAIERQIKSAPFHPPSHPSPLHSPSSSSSSMQSASGSSSLLPLVRRHPLMGGNPSEPSTSASPQPQPAERETAKKAREAIARQTSGRSESHLETVRERAVPQSSRTQPSDLGSPPAADGLSSTSTAAPPSSQAWTPDQWASRADSRPGGKRICPICGRTMVEAMLRGHISHHGKDERRKKQGEIEGSLGEASSSSPLQSPVPPSTSITRRTSHPSTRVDQPSSSAVPQEPRTSTRKMKKEKEDEEEKNEKEEKRERDPSASSSPPDKKRKEAQAAPPPTRGRRGTAVPTRAPIAEPSTADLAAPSSSSAVTPPPNQPSISPSSSPMVEQAAPSSARSSRRATTIDRQRRLVEAPPTADLAAVSSSSIDAPREPSPSPSPPVKKRKMESGTASSSASKKPTKRSQHGAVLSETSTPQPAASSSSSVDPPAGDPTPSTSSTKKRKRQLVEKKDGDETPAEPERRRPSTDHRGKRKNESPPQSDDEDESPPKKRPGPKEKRDCSPGEREKLDKSRDAMRKRRKAKKERAAMSIEQETKDETEKDDKRAKGKRGRSLLNETRDLPSTSSSSSKQKKKKNKKNKTESAADEGPPSSSTQSSQSSSASVQNGQVANSLPAWARPRRSARGIAEPEPEPPVPEAKKTKKR